VYKGDVLTKHQTTWPHTAVLKKVREIYTNISYC